MLATATSCKFEGTVTESAAQHFADPHRRLYTQPTVARRVNRLVRQPQLDREAVLRLLEADPVLSARLLGFAQKYQTGPAALRLDTAAASLHSTALRAVLLAFHVPEDDAPDWLAHSLDWLWTDSQLRREALLQLVDHLKESGCERLPPRETVALAGAWQSLGIQALLVELGQDYAEFLEQAVRRPQSLPELERQILGFDHLEVSWRILQNWSVPTELCGLLQPGLSRERGLLELVDLMSRYLQTRDDHLLRQLVERGHAAYELDPLDLEQLLERIVSNSPVDEGPGNGPGMEPFPESSFQTLDEAHGLLSHWVEPWLAICGEMMPDSGSENGRLGNEPARVRQYMKLGKFAGGIIRRSESAVAETTPNDSDAEGSLLKHLLAERIAKCRASQAPLSLVLIRTGERDEDAALRLELVLAEAVASPLQWCRVDHETRAILMPARDRQAALELTRRLRNRLHFAAGIASLLCPPPNYPPQEMIDAASRCLYAADRGGGNGIKSIDL